MLVPTRNYSSPSYRYGFQGQEKDDEIKGSGNSINYKYRMHDPRVGRFFAVDPLASRYTHNSPYAFSENRVIDRIELEGLESHQFFDDILLKTSPHLKTDDVETTVGKVTTNALTKMWNGVVEAGRLLRGRPFFPITEEEKQDAKRDVENEKAIAGAIIKEITSDPGQELSKKFKSMIDGTYVSPTKAERLGGLEDVLSIVAEVGVLSRLKVKPKTSKIIDIDKGIIGKKIDINTQGKHLSDSNQYKVNVNDNNVHKSILTENAQTLLDEFHKGDFKVLSITEGSKSILVDFGKPIGDLIEKGTGKNLGATNYGAIKYGENKVHITPVKVNKTN